MANSKVDMELKKAFTGLQMEMIESAKKIKLIDAQISTLVRASKHNEITEQEISALPLDTRTYESLGRAFLLNDVNTIKKNLQERKETIVTKAAELEKTKQRLEKSLKESEDNIREMVQQRKQIESN